jgi:hypothetical protein
MRRRIRASEASSPATIMSLRVRPEPEQGGLPSRLEDIPPNRPHGACFRVSLPR